VCALGEQVVVIRYEGPKGGPGMPEMLTPTSAIMGEGARRAGCGRGKDPFCGRRFQCPSGGAAGGERIQSGGL
jgi:hypothetical protein